MKILCLDGEKKELGIFPLTYVCCRSLWCRQVLKQNLGIGGVISLLWFQRRLPPYACKFIEMCLMVTADHGPAVSGAHNTIVCARAGKDLVSSLVSGLLTIVSAPDSVLFFFVLSFVLANLFLFASLLIGSSLI